MARGPVHEAGRLGCEGDGAVQDWLRPFRSACGLVYGGVEVLRNGYRALHNGTEAARRGAGALRSGRNALHDGIEAVRGG